MGDRFYSCVIDGTQLDASGKLEADPDHPELLRPTYKIELPGFPILGNGKSDNQNMAIPFSRGPIIQAIDCNQACLPPHASVQPPRSTRNVSIPVVVSEDVTASHPRSTLPR